MLQYEIINILSEHHKDQLLKLYQNEWWSVNRTKQDINTILQGPSIIIGILDKQIDRLVGFARILTDSFKYAHIYDVIVNEDYRNKGLGAFIMETIINHPKLLNIKNIELTCKKEMIMFY